MQSTRTDAGDDEEDELGVEHGEDGGGEGADDVFERPAVAGIKRSETFLTISRVKNGQKMGSALEE